MVCVCIMNRMSAQSSGFTQRRRMALGIVILLLVDVIWVASSELTSFADAEGYFAACTTDTTMNSSLSEPLYVPVKFHDLPSEKPENTNIDTEKTPKKSRVRFSNIMEIRQLPSSHALEAKLSRMSYPTVKEQESILKAVGKLTATQVAKISFFFCFVWFLANLSYQEALSDTQVAIVNILSSTSGLFTLILAAVFPSNSGDRFTLSKLLAVILSIGGVVLVNLSGSEKSAGRNTIVPAPLAPAAAARAAAHTCGRCLAPILIAQHHEQCEQWLPALITPGPTRIRCKHPVLAPIIRRSLGAISGCEQWLPALIVPEGFSTSPCS
ncbi:Solute carrier family 35 member F5 [Myotis davidii]|uniref:Solute carrier family 35 member F5 n=1 Tax=Myotis davidii TaxID=225400 RepID=L5M2D2_MYODS|nr:Solute carrier family 35 member F5 [Myotis davidii]